jgi:hypothetical protein
MMKLLAAVLLGVFLIAGCDGHYIRQKDNCVYLYLKDGHAREVLFSSSLDGFKCQRAHKIDEDTWMVIVLNAGEFKYFYIIDGNVHIPDCKYREKDDFGAYNCLYRTDM